jgi:cobalamin biosynthesis Mg chelatase CobN
MSLTRKRKKELKRLRSGAEDLWNQQQEVLANANALAAEARKQAAYYTREEIAPRVRDGYEHYVRPAAEGAKATAGRYVGQARQRVITDVIPAVGTAVGTALSVVDHARAARAAAFAGEFKKAGKELSMKTKAASQKSGPGAGSIIAIGLGIIAAVGLLYAVWQTFRADDELWVADEEPSTPVTEPPTQQ